MRQLIVKSEIDRANFGESRALGPSLESHSSRGKNFLSAREIFIAQLPKKGGKSERARDLYLGIERIGKVNDRVDRDLY